MNKFLKFEPETEGWRKDSTTSFSIRARTEPEEPIEERRAEVIPPTLSRAQDFNTAYGTSNSTYSGRLRRRSAGSTPADTRVVTGADRIRNTRIATSVGSPSGGAASSGGSSSGGY